MDGLLLVDKPEGISSFGVVSKIRWLITQEKHRIHNERGFCHDPSQRLTAAGKCKCKVKVGHTGTLDPAATGLLVIAIGGYTKKVPMLIKQDKTYLVTMTLGKTSTTGDKEGDITDITDKKPPLPQVVATLGSFTGDIMQTPPAFSAIKVNGQRAYNLARKGQDVILQSRPVKIYSNKLISYSYPAVQFESAVSSGTYIRSLVQDIGNSLKTGAYMSDLRRTAVGDFDINNSVKFNGITYEIIQNNIRTLTKSPK